MNSASEVENTLARVYGRQNQESISKMESTEKTKRNTTDLESFVLRKGNNISQDFLDSSLQDHFWIAQSGVIF